MWGRILDQLFFFIGQVRIEDVLDVLLVWLVVYKVLILIRRTGTIQMLSGMGILALGYILSIWLDLHTFNWLLEKFFSNLFVIVVILFQGEIRRALAQIGSNPFFSDISTVRETQIAEEIAQALQQMAERGYGALIVIEREILVDYHVEMGTEIDAAVSAELLISIFHPTAPMHDGAVLIRGGKIHSAGCFLPLSKNPALDKNLGTRHRAALGLTEETDAVVFLVSEEQRTIGIVSSGQLRTNVQIGDVRRALYKAYDLHYKAPAEALS